MTRIILDTNAYSELCKGNSFVKKIFKKANTVYIPAVVLGELFYGFKRGNKENDNLNLLKMFLDQKGLKIVNIDGKTASIYAEIKLELTKNGTPISENDIWIAASAIETGSTVITYDKHFLKIPKIKVWKNLKK
ncbi:type II toxin-antitoxin system VapC family toxin [Candidatus Microgenomates bacterium]|nr:type II toxin-antitoxin system VapC family toxin [Candidatus Microgenomates bacterium]